LTRGGQGFIGAAVAIARDLAPVTAVLDDGESVFASKPAAR
jgi:hypothetical protein